MSRRRVVTDLMLFAALLLFQGMALASAAVERTAAGTGDQQLTQAAETWAYEWRHGMTGGWPLFVPGFVAVAFAVRWASDRRSAIRFGWVYATLLAFASVAAWLASRPIGDRLARHSFHLGATEMPDRMTSPSLAAVMLAAGTVTCWVILVTTSVRAAATRSGRRLLAAAVPYGILAVARPGDLGELARPWATATAAGEPTALVSTLLLAAGIGWLVSAAVGSRSSMSRA